MTNDQEDLLLCVARIVLGQLQQRRQANADPTAAADDEYTRETARLLDELRAYDPPNDTTGETKP